MPRYVARVNVSAVIEVEAASYEEAKTFAARSIGADQERPDICLTVAGSNSEPVALTEVDAFVGMIGQRSMAA